MSCLLYEARTRMAQCCRGQPWAHPWMFEFTGWPSAAVDNPGLTHGCSSLQDGPVLPWTTLGSPMDVRVYRMVQCCRGQPWVTHGCSSLQDGPVLPWTTLGSPMDVRVYRMVQCCRGQPWVTHGCSSLQDGPVLPWTTLGSPMDVLVYRMVQCCRGQPWAHPWMF